MSFRRNFIPTPISRRIIRAVISRRETVLPCAGSSGPMDHFQTAVTAAFPTEGSSDA